VLMTETNPIARCSQCDEEKESVVKSDGTVKLPRGWMEFAGQPYCRKCKGTSLCVRAISLPVAGPVDMEWKELRTLLAAAWSRSRSAANLMERQLASRDVVRTAAMEKLPAAPKLSADVLYQPARALVPQLPSGTVSAIQKHVADTYMKQRYESIWTGDRSFRNFKYPYPIRVRVQDYTLGFVEHDGKEYPSVSLRLESTAVDGAKRITLRLRGGRGFDRFMGDFRRLIDGTAKAGELIITRQRANESDHRPGIGDRSSGGGSRIIYRIMCKIVGRFPRRKKNDQQRTGTLNVRTGSGSFWFVTEEGEERSWLNADHMRRAHAAHALFLGRIADDTKFEKRTPRRNRRQIDGYRATRVDKHKNRIKTFVDQACRSLVGYAARRGYAKLEYDDRDRQYMPSFDYSQIEARLKILCQEAQLELVIVRKDRDDRATATPSADPDGA